MTGSLASCRVRVEYRAIRFRVRDPGPCRRLAGVDRYRDANGADGEQGAKYQSLFLLELGTGRSPVIHFAQRDVILLLTQGQGNINISSHNFDIKPETGIYVRPGEQFRLHNTGPEKLVIFAAVCPLAKAPEFADELVTNFNEAYPRRTLDHNSL